MMKTFDIKKLESDKIALLCLFALSLLTARIVVGLKSALVLSDPIPLNVAGISLSVPTGNGWQSPEKWILRGNSFVLNSSFSAGPGEPTAGVICLYQPAARANTVEMLLERKARKYDGVIVSIDRIETDSLTFDWALIKSENSSLTAFIGTAFISEDWQLDIEVFEITGNTEQADKTFRKIVESVILEDDRPRTASSRN